MRAQKNHRVGRFLTCLLSAALCITLNACGSGGGSTTEPPAAQPPPSVPPPPIAGYTYQVPSANGDGWSVAHAAEVGIAPTRIEAVVNRIQQNQIPYRFIDAMLIARHGKLVFEKRFRTEFDFTDDLADNRDIDLHIIYSVSKSFAATLIGIAIDKGYLPSVDVKVHDYYWDKQPIANWDERKANITLKDWLTMQSGYAWDEWSAPYGDSRNQHTQMLNAADPTQFLLDTPMATTPGTTFTYSTGVSFGLGDLIRRASGQGIDAFMEQHLFQPLSINRYDSWLTGGQIHLGGGLYLTIRDMAKLGQLHLDDGVWNGQRIVSSEWVRESTRNQLTPPDSGYGYQWWLTTFSSERRQFAAYYAAGLGGQFVYVIPDLGAVIAFHSSTYLATASGQSDVRHIIETELIPAML